jgi:hypothetical protein
MKFEIRECQVIKASDRCWRRILASSTILNGANIIGYHSWHVQGPERTMPTLMEEEARICSGEEIRGHVSEAMSSNDERPTSSYSCPMPNMKRPTVRHRTELSEGCHS